MEFWDVYDKDRKLKGFKIMRGGGRRLGKDEYHLTAHVCLFSSDGRLLMQKRTGAKPLWGGLWDVTAGGSVLAGENSSGGAQRELFEELGISTELSGATPCMTFYHKDCISDYFVAIKDVNLSGLTLQDTEVTEVRYATREEVLDLLATGSFVPYKKSFIELLFDISSGEEIFKR